MRLYKGHDPFHGEDGTDLFLTIYDDGTHEIATRPGRGRTQVTWGPPVTLKEEVIA